MKAIILAAGRGSRLNDLTDDKPKCMVEVCGASLLDWQTKALKSAGVSDVKIIRGYRKEMITGPFEFLENPRWMETQMVATLACADEALAKETHLISYSDIICHPDHMKTLMTNPGDIAITYDTEWERLWRARLENPEEDAETFEQEGGFLKEIGGKANSIAEISGQYMGLVKITPAGWFEISKYLNEIGKEKADRLDMTGLLSGLLKKGVAVSVSAVSGKWVEVDTQDDIAVYEKNITEPGWLHDWRYSGK